MTTTISIDERSLYNLRFADNVRRNFTASPSLSTRPTNGCRARSTSLWVHRNVFWQLSRNENLHSSDTSHPRTASSNLSFVVSRGNAGWTTLKSGHLCQYQNFLQRTPAEKTGGGSLLNRSPCPLDDPITQETELK